ncbi:MAG TPA: bifunctional aldolase/short-chain dehydrogenase [Ktedonobacterales bacterium]|nr:bifunctional aldolase/short-chain dehydrogenase [Ktedonobacterales bacterium]
MRSRWNDEEAARYATDGELGLRVYTSRLLGSDPSLVLHGGGNTSVKVRERNVLGEEEDILYVKGSGWDLATIESAGFAPVRLPRLLGLAQLDALSDTRMASELKSNMTDAAAPAPSVEAILHAILPHPFVDHTHADALIALTNTPHGMEQAREVYGEVAVIVPYEMPGFRLARLCARLFPEQAGDHTIGMVLLNHGLFSFGETARASYERMIQLVTMAEDYLAAHNAWTISLAPDGSAPEVQAPLDRVALASLRREVSEAAGAPMIVAAHSDEHCLRFARRDDLARIARQGPATPDHVIRTKRLPLIGHDVRDYADEYQRSFAEYAPRLEQDGHPLTMLDPAPRVILDGELGMCVVGRTAKDAAIAEDIYRHTMEIILRAEALDAYQALPPWEIFEVEYWDLEQAKLRRQEQPRVFAGEVALVTGAASGIGKACVEALIQRGAAVLALDLNPAIEGMWERPDVLGVRCDVTDEADLSRALDSGVAGFGGLDMLILNAGIFPASRRIEALDLGEWDRVLRVNLDANVALLRESHPLLKLAPRGGRVAIIGSKNVPAPGPGAAAYSASKAALTQLARVAALEWGGDGIRVNVLHPNQVFDTAIWTEEVLRSRAAQYGLSVEEYRRNNVLRVEVTSRDVAELAAEFCGPLFARTTGAQIPVDGGNERVI